MTSCSNSLRRARPLLGTVVDISVSGAPAERLAAAVDRAFGVVARIDALMSFHRPSSDVSRLNRCAWRHAVRVHPWTWHVLRAADELRDRTFGLVDCTIGPTLGRWGFLPPSPASPRPTTRLVKFQRGRRIRFGSRFAVDLGGIAKGFAVDRAVASLKADGVPAGAVNAGGDLRVFGAEPQPVHVRDPADRHRAWKIGLLKEGAVATSAVTESRRRFRQRLVSPIVDPRWGRPYVGDRSVSVIASSCMIADALTKPMLLNPRVGRRALVAFGARAVFVAGPAAAE